MIYRLTEFVGVFATVLVQNIMNTNFSFCLSRNETIDAQIIENIRRMDIMTIIENILSFMHVRKMADTSDPEFLLTEMCHIVL